MRNNNFSADDNVVIRKRAVSIIVQIRARESYDLYKATIFGNRAPPPSIRPFQTPIIDFTATSYDKMIKLHPIKGPYDGSDAPQLCRFKVFSPGSTVKSKAEWNQLTEPPLTKQLTIEEIRNFIDTPLKSEYPCHTQAVEHGVAAVSRAVKQRKTERAQLIQLRQTDAAIRENPGPITKKRRI